MGCKNGEHQQRPLSNSPHGGGGLCATDVPVEPPRILIPRRLEALKEHVRQEAAIVSKHAETSQKPPSLSLSRQYFCFAKAGPSSRKSTSHMTGGFSRLVIFRMARFGRPKRGLPCRWALFPGPTAEWPDVKSPVLYINAAGPHWTPSSVSASALQRSLSLLV
jgi:hypothetical protein